MTFKYPPFAPFGHRKPHYCALSSQKPHAVERYNKDFKNKKSDRQAQ